LDVNGFAPACAVQSAADGDGDEVE
jgi:hypothetical protein